MACATVTNLLISEGIVDHIANMYFITDDSGDAVEVIDEFFKFFPRLAQGKIGCSVQRLFLDSVCTTARVTVAPWWIP